MKIALVYDAIYPYIKGGGEKRIYEIGRRLAKRGYQIHLYGMKLWEGENTIKREGMYLHGICKAMRLYTKDGKRSIKQAIYFGLSSLKLIREGFDIIDCCAFPFFSLFSCKLISLHRRKPLVVSWYEVWDKDYWHEYLGWKGYFGYIIEKLAVFMADKIISSSDHTAVKLKNELNLRKSIYTIVNGVEYNKINKIEPSEEKSDVIFTGRLLPNKNIDLLIKSIGIVVKKNPAIKLIIVGEGPEAKNLEKLVQILKLENNVKFIGFRENIEDVYALIKSSRVFVLPSTREGFGMVVIEANACGIPVITVEHINNAASDLIEEGYNGFISKPESREISERIIRIIKNNLDKKLKESCKRSAKQYDWDIIVDKIEKIYSE